MSELQYKQPESSSPLLGRLHGCGSSRDEGPSGEFIPPSIQHYWGRLLSLTASEASAGASHLNINNASVVHPHMKRKKKTIKRGQDRVEGQNLIKIWLITSAFCYHPDVTASAMRAQSRPTKEE